MAAVRFAVPPAACCVSCGGECGGVVMDAVKVKAGVGEWRFRMRCACGRRLEVVRAAHGALVLADGLCVRGVSAGDAESVESEESAVGRNDAAGAAAGLARRKARGRAEIAEVAEREEREFEALKGACNRRAQRAWELAESAAERLAAKRRRDEGARGRLGGSVAMETPRPGDGDAWEEHAAASTARRRQARAAAGGAVSRRGRKGLKRSRLGALTVDEYCTARDAIKKLRKSSVDLSKLVQK